MYLVQVWANRCRAIFSHTSQEIDYFSFHLEYSFVKCMFEIKINRLTFVLVGFFFGDIPYSSASLFPFPPKFSFYHGRLV